MMITGIPRAADGTGLRGFVHIVVLDLAEVPVPGVQHLQKLIGVPVEGETDVPDGAGSLLFLNPLRQAQRNQPFPLRGVGHMMHQIIVDMIRPEAGQLLLEDFFGSRRVPDHVLGQLGGDQHLIPQVVFLQNGAEKRFAARINIGGIVIIDARVPGGQDFLFRLFQIQTAAFAGKTHASVAKDGQILPVSVFAVFHTELLPGPAGRRSAVC